MITLTELLPDIRQLAFADKVRLIRILAEEIEVSNSQPSHHFFNFINCFLSTEKRKVDLSQDIISREIFREIFKIKLALWRMKEFYKRAKRQNIADIFQDIVTLYLKQCLPVGFEVVQEEAKKGGLQPDIVIYCQGAPIFIIEIKTTIGWSRVDWKKGLVDRIDILSKNYDLPQNNVIFIFLTPWGIKELLETYIHRDTLKHKDKPTEFPFTQIKPLFSHGEDPFYYSKDKDLQLFADFDDDRINKESEGAILTRFEEILSMIQNSAGHG